MKNMFLKNKQDRLSHNKIPTKEIELKKRLGIPLNINFKPVKLLIGIPSRGMVSAHWVIPLLKQGNPINTTIEYRFIIGKEVGIARNELVEEALKMKADYLFFLDDDVIISPNTITRLINIADEKKDIVAGVYYTKQIPPQPLIFKGRGTGSFKNWKVGEILDDIDGVGMGLTLIKTEIFEKLKKPWFKTIEAEKFTTKQGQVISFSTDEALYFCNKAIAKGFRITVDTSIQGIHYDCETDTFYFNSKGKPVAVRKGKVIFPITPSQE